MDNADEFIDTQKLVQAYMKSNYRIIGKSKHSAIKPCHWLTEKLLTGRENRNCYKGYFGIESETCIQNTPALPFCNHQCVFCWRDIENASFGEVWKGPVDPPKKIVSEMIRHSENLITEHITLKKSLDNLEIMQKVLKYYLEYKNTNPKEKIIGFTEKFMASELEKTITKTHRAMLLLKNCGVLSNPNENDYLLTPQVYENLNRISDIEQILKEMVTTKEEIVEAFKKAKNPKHAAISLAGEPTLYPKIGDLVSEFRKRKMCTFIVSNGTHPEVIQKMWKNRNLPTQLYITLPAPTKQDFAKICRPLTSHAWEKLKETLKILPQLPCRTVIRITAVKYLNIDDAMIPLYGQLLTENPPNFIDIKAFTVEAHALELENRLGKLSKGHALREFAPSFEDLLHFAEGLSQYTGFPIIETHETSKDILLRGNWPHENPIKIDFENV